MSAWTAIGRADVGAAGASTIEFSSIPNTYTDLIIVLSVRCNQGAVWDWLTMSFNGSSSGYTSRRLYGSGSGASSNSQSTTAYSENGLINGNSATSSTFATVIVEIPNYAGTQNKSVFITSGSENNATEAYLLEGVSLWSNSAAITSIVIDSAAGGTWLQYSSANLYGVLKGSSGGVTVT